MNQDELDKLCPGFIDRDRFVLSSGHASALLYAALHLAVARALALVGRQP